MYGDLSEELRNKFQRAINYLIRFIFVAGRDAHITPVYLKLNMLKLMERIEYFICFSRSYGPSYFKYSFRSMPEVNFGKLACVHSGSRLFFIGSLRSMSRPLWWDVGFGTDYKWKVMTESVASFKTKIFFLLFNSS